MGCRKLQRGKMWKFQEILLCIEIDNLSLEDHLVFSFIEWSRYQDN